MPAYEVRRRKPQLVSVVVEASSERQALNEAVYAFVSDMSDRDAFEVRRQPLGPDDDGDARSEARYETEHDADDEATEQRLKPC